MNGVNQEMDYLFKIVTHEDGSEWLEGVHNYIKPIQVKVTRCTTRAYNMQTGNSATISAGPWKIAGVQHD